MLFSTTAILAMAAMVAAAPADGDLHARASCTFKDAKSAIAGKKSCSTIVLQDIAVPAVCMYV